MDDQIKQIAERLKGLRDALELSVDDVARQFDLPVAEYVQYESGNSDIPMSFLCSVAKANHIELTSLISGDDPHMSSYFVTRNGKGISVERVKDYKYQALASGFKNPKGEPFLVTVEPKPEPFTMHLNTHFTEEFNLVLAGKLLLRYGDKDLILQEGDSIYFDAKKPHGMKALEGKPVRFLAVIL